MTLSGEKICTLNFFINILNHVVWCIISLTHFISSNQIIVAWLCEWNKMEFTILLYQWSDDIYMLYIGNT